MKGRPIATILLFSISFAVTFIAPIFDTSLYGVNGHPTEWLSFSPGSPLRYLGISLFFSPFIHLNFEHLLTNMVFFIPVGMMIERKRSGISLMLNFFLIHFQVLLALVIIHAFFPLEGKAFLGSSHVIIGLYSFWSLTNKKYGLFFFALLIIVVGFWQSQGPLVLLAHGLGFLIGLELLLLGRFWSKLRTHPSN